MTAFKFSEGAQLISMTGVEMEFQQLEMFAAVVEEGSVSRAADRVCRTAPAVSIALRKLEEEMGIPLFDRSTRNDHQITTAGKLLYSYATRILEMRQAAMISVKDLILGRRGTLRLGTHESVSLYLLPSIIRRFHELHTDVNIEILCGPSEQMLTAIHGDMIDLAIIADVPDEPGFERQLMMQDELVLITDPKHRLATAKSVAVRELADEFLLVQGPKSKIRARIVQALKERNTAFRFAAENVAIEGIKRMVADGLGIGFVPLMCVREEAARGELSILRVQDIPDRWSLFLVHRKDLPLSDAVRTFIQVSFRSESTVEKRINKAKAFSLGPRKAMHC